MKLTNIINLNKTKIIGLLTILISLWLVLYLIPNLFVSLFNTLLGNLILLISIILVYMNNKLYALGLGLVLIILYRFSHLSKENFQINVSGTFNIDEEDTSKDELNEDFLKIQNTINKIIIYCTIYV